MVRQRSIALLLALLVTAACPPVGDGADASATAVDETSTSEATTTTSGATTLGDTIDPPTTSEPMTSSTGLPTTTGDGSTTGDTTTTTTTTTSTSTGPGSICGDGVIEGDEACDDGAANGDDQACTSVCTAASCGDGLVWADHEECDLGLDNSNEGACTKACESAWCGDHFIQTGVEACDEGANNNGSVYDGCVPGTCQLGPHCGDKVVQPDFEECDDADPDLDETDAKCTGCAWESKIIFVTSELYFGDFGGLGEANTRCQDLAEAAGLANSPSFRAWLSNGVKSPSTEMTPSLLLPYARVDGVKIAKNWADLIDGQLLAPILINENSDPIDPAEALVWTSTSTQGTPAKLSQHCDGWTNMMWPASATVGDATRADNRWTEFAKKDCNYAARLYCVEQ